MEKLKFTVRCIVLLAAFPVIMYTELTRDDKPNSDLKQNTVEQLSLKKDKKDNVAILNCYSPFMQAVL